MSEIGKNSSLCFVSLFWISYLYVGIMCYFLTITSITKLNIVSIVFDIYRLIYLHNCLIESIATSRKRRRRMKLILGFSIVSAMILLGSTFWFIIQKKIIKKTTCEEGDSNLHCSIFLNVTSSSIKPIAILLSEDNMWGRWF